jgi:hypothetical protein
MPYALFLDDERDPATTALDPAWRAATGLPPLAPHGLELVIARTFAEACAIVRDRGFPRFVHFDNDLGERHEGRDFAHWLVQRDLDLTGLPADFAYDVHSRNPIGREAIIGLLEPYLSLRRTR